MFKTNIYDESCNGNSYNRYLTKISMEECVLAGVPVVIYGVAKGSGMLHPDMATTLGFVFTDAKISGNILKQLLKKIFKTL